MFLKYVKIYHPLPICDYISLYYRDLSKLIFYQNKTA